MMVGWHHRLNGHEFEQTQGDSEEQGSLVCCSPWGCRVGHDRDETTTMLGIVSNTKMKKYMLIALRISWLHLVESKAVSLGFESKSFYLPYVIFTFILCNFNSKCMRDL